jgi:hypothetical protein
MTGNRKGDPKKSFVLSFRITTGTSFTEMFEAKDWKAFHLVFDQIEPSFPHCDLWRNLFDNDL